MIMRPFCRSNAKLERLLDWLLAVYKIAFPVLVCQELRPATQCNSSHVASKLVLALLSDSARVWAAPCAGVPDAGKGLWVREGGGLAGGGGADKGAARQAPAQPRQGAAGAEPAPESQPGLRIVLFGKQVGITIAPCFQEFCLIIASSF